MLVAIVLALIIFVAPALGVLAGIAGMVKERRDKRAAITALITRWR